MRRHDEDWDAGTGPGDLKFVPAPTFFSSLKFGREQFSVFWGFVTCPILLSMRVKKGLGSRLGKQHDAR